MGTSHERARRLALKSGTFMNLRNTRRMLCSEFGDTISEIGDTLSQSGTSCLKSGTLLKIGDPISEIGDPSETRDPIYEIGDPSENRDTISEIGDPFTSPPTQTKIEINIRPNKTEPPRGARLASYVSHDRLIVEGFEPMVSGHPPEGPLFCPLDYRLGCTLAQTPNR